jgi:hypothetical protein
MRVLFIESRKFTEQGSTAERSGGGVGTGEQAFAESGQRRLDPRDRRFSQDPHETVRKRKERWRLGGLFPPERSSRHLPISSLYQERTERLDRRAERRPASTGALSKATMKKKPLEIEFDAQELVAAVQDS